MVVGTLHMTSHYPEIPLKAMEGAKCHTKSKLLFVT